MTDIPMTPAGWHPDPEGKPTLRWWDGNRWTEQLAPLHAVTAPQATGQSAGQTNVMAVMCFVFALLWLGGLGSLLAVIFGEIARTQMKNVPGQRGGGLASVGRILGALGLVLSLLYFVSNASAGA